MSARLNPATKFWLLAHPAQSPAVIDGQSGRTWSYGELDRDVQQAMGRLCVSGTKSLWLLLAQNRYECLVIHLAALRSGNALLLVDATLDRQLLAGLIRTYRPEFVCAIQSDLELPQYRPIEDLGLAVWQTDAAATPESAIHSSLAMLLNTSGSTGSPKLVRLTCENLQANAAAIASYLELTADERPITALPMAYSYGLSVINSHLLAGATLVLTEHGVLRREFWDSVDRHACSSLSGVPHSYQMLLQTGLLGKRGASLRTLTQAGGRLDERLVRQLHELAQRRGLRVFIMYGQTEATARIAYLPFEQFGNKIGSIGIPVPGGSLRVDADGELIYAGPNVMMGYAECRQDLAKGDELGSVLHTGDLARRDADGYFYITGRLRRFLKLFGKRFNLDEVEQILQRRFELPTACFGRDDLLMVAVEVATASNDSPVEAITATLRELFHLPRDAMQVRAVSALPRTANGKIDYRALSAEPATAAQNARLEVQRA
jgi:long-chain acyl-CoA synthetase